MMKRIAALLLTLAVALCAALPVFAAGTIEVTEDDARVLLRAVYYGA